jgi:diguanylate cyclase (GGDEF)-like protein
MSVKELLARVPLFHQLAEEDLDRLAQATQRVSFAAGETVVEIGDPGRSLYVIVDGTVRVLYPARSSDFELARLGPGDFFGEMALLNDRPRSATVKAVDRVVALVVDKDDFRGLIVDSTTFALRLMEAMSVRIRHADAHISNLSDTAVRDPLTGLLNRRAFGERLRQEIDKVRRYGDCFSLVMVDLDHFGRINETVGGDAGDAILSWVGRLLTELTRAADVPFRIDGVGFAVLCPATPAAVAGTVARRLVEVVSEAKPPGHPELSVTMSAGFATCPDHGLSEDDLYYVADQALRHAKASGRNQVSTPEVAIPSD